MPYLDLIQAEPLTSPANEETKKPASTSDDPWLAQVRGAFAPVLYLPPRGCLGRSVCSRLGPCDRHAAGQPCDVRRPDEIERGRIHDR